MPEAMIMDSLFALNAKQLNDAYSGVFLKLPKPARMAIYRALSLAYRRNAASDEFPDRFIFYVTHRCNLSCSHCFFAGPVNAGALTDLSLAEIRKFCRSLPRPVKLLTITGGEPMLREDISGVCVTFLQGRRVRSLSINTNGYFPKKTETLAEKLLRGFPGSSFNFQVSLDGFRGTHNAIRKDPFSFDKALETIERLKKLYSGRGNFGKLSVLTTVSGLNLDEATSLYEFIEKKYKVFHKFQILKEGPGNKDFCAAHSPAYGKLCDFFKFLHDKAWSRNEHALFNALEMSTWEHALEIYNHKERKFECLAGRKEAVIYPDGEVALCEEAFRIGGLRENAYSFSRVWSSPRARALRAGKKECRCLNYCHISSSLVFDEGFLKTVCGV